MTTTNYEYMLNNLLSNENRYHDILEIMSSKFGCNGHSDYNMNEPRPFSMDPEFDKDANVHKGPWTTGFYAMGVFDGPTGMKVYEDLKIHDRYKFFKYQNKKLSQQSLDDGVYRLMSSTKLFVHWAAAIAYDVGRQTDSDSWDKLPGGKFTEYLLNKYKIEGDVEVSNMSLDRKFEILKTNVFRVETDTTVTDFTALNYDGYFADLDPSLRDTNIYSTENDFIKAKLENLDIPIYHFFDEDDGSNVITEFTSDDDTSGDTITDTKPGFRILLSQLLNHTSGITHSTGQNDLWIRKKESLTGYFNQFNFFRPVITSRSDELVELNLKEYIRFESNNFKRYKRNILYSEPGLEGKTNWTYGNMNENILGRILEVIYSTSSNEKSLQTVLKDILFDPLGMTSTGFNDQVLTKEMIDNILRSQTTQLWQQDIWDPNSLEEGNSYISYYHEGYYYPYQIIGEGEHIQYGKPNNFTESFYPGDQWWGSTHYNPGQILFLGASNCFSSFNDYGKFSSMLANNGVKPDETLMISSHTMTKWLSESKYPVSMPSERKLLGFGCMNRSIPKDADGVDLVDHGINHGWEGYWSTICSINTGSTTPNVGNRSYIYFTQSVRPSDNEERLGPINEMIAASSDAAIGKVFGNWEYALESYNDLEYDGGVLDVNDSNNLGTA